MLRARRAWKAGVEDSKTFLEPYGQIRQHGSTAVRRYGRCPRSGSLHVTVRPRYGTRHVPGQKSLESGRKKFKNLLEPSGQIGQRGSGRTEVRRYGGTAVRQDGGTADAQGQGHATRQSDDGTVPGMLRARRAWKVGVEDSKFFLEQVCQIG